MVQLAIMCQRRSERSAGAGAVLSFNLYGREIQAQVLDCSAIGLSIGLSEDVVIMRPSIVDPRTCFSSSKRIGVWAVLNHRST